MHSGSRPECFVARFAIIDNCQPLYQNFGLIISLGPQRPKKMLKPGFNYVGSRMGALFVLLTIAACANVKLPAIFSDRMVLQRDAAAPAWGWADPGEAGAVNPKCNLYNGAGLPAAPFRTDTW
jgi:hypothetical protein